jgi:hypothetical protein
MSTLPYFINNELAIFIGKMNGIKSIWTSAISGKFVRLWICLSISNFYFKWYFNFCKKKVEDTKEVIKSRKSKKDRQYNDKMKTKDNRTNKYLQNITLNNVSLHLNYMITFLFMLKFLILSFCKCISDNDKVDTLYT